ncbi:rootletin-like [Manihot esculenta]|uniref:rootletin-like n=1 Tax=Manihot esculenta TaxID=3983 RepID=UPI001CC5F19D|nr:rootletin-like [Manihot esculenta]
MAEGISSRSAIRPPFPPVSSQAPRSSSRRSKSSRPSSHSRSSSARQSSQAPRPRRSSTERTKEVPRVPSAVTEDTVLTRTDPVSPSEEAPEVRMEVPVAKEDAPEGRREVILTSEGTQEAPVGVAPASEGVGPSPVDSGSVGEKVGDKQDITHQSPASVVAKIIKERMFGGVIEASDPRLLALTSLLASSTREQAAFWSRPRGELGDTIREMLLMVMGLFMEVDARDHSLQESMDCRVEEARLEENLSATSDARSNLAAAHEHAKSLEAELSHAWRVLKESDERATAAKVRCEEVLKQLSSTVDAFRERDEAQRQYEALKADFEGAQARLNKVEVQKEGALAWVEVLEQELSKSSDRIRDLASTAEESKLHNQKLCHEVQALEHRCSALLEDARLVEDRIQLECERRLMEYKESPELKKKIEQACEARLQDYKSSSEFKAMVAEACEERLAEFKASGEMKTAIWNKSFRMFVSRYNRGLRTARYAPSTPLAELRAAEEDSDGEAVLYGEDDRPLPKRASSSAAGPSEAEPELGNDGAGPQGQEIVPVIPG